MIFKKKLVIKKSVAEDFLKSHADRKLEYFKKEILKVLNRQEKEESDEEVSKAFIVQELYKSMTDPLYMEKGKVGVVGEIRTWNGKKYKKMPNKKWVRVYDKETRGAKLAIAALRRKIDACKTSQDLLDLVLANRERFQDGQGRPLPIVQELSKYVSAKNDSIESSGNKKQDKAKKKGALKVLNKQEIHDFIEKHKTSKVNERVSLGAISDDARNRIKAATGIDVERVILDSDSIRHSFIPKHNLEENDLDDMKEIIDTTTDISLSHDKNSMGNPVIIFKKQEPNGVILCEEYRAGKKELELQTAYRVKKNRQPLSAENQPLANVQNVTAPTNNVAHNNTVVNKKDEKSERAEAVKKHIEDKLNEYMNDSYTKSSAYRFIKKYGKKRLEEIANGNVKSDGEYKKWLADRIVADEKERGENVSDYTIDTAIWKHCVAFYEREAAREKLKSMEANEKTPDLPVDEKDMQEAENIIGADVKLILDGRDTYGTTKQTLTDKIRRRIRNNPGVARAMLVYIKQEQERTGKKVYTEKHSIWEELPKLNENAKEALKNGESETKTGVSGNLYEGDDGTTVVENKDWGRYQISFPGKPDRETISTLKHNGFRWSPSTKTWVCFNTANGEYSLKQVAEKLGLKKTGDVQKSFASIVNDLKRLYFQRCV